MKKILGIVAGIVGIISVIVGVALKMNNNTADNFLFEEKKVK